MNERLIKVPAAREAVPDDEYAMPYTRLVRVSTPQGDKVVTEVYTPAYFLPPKERH